MDNKLSGGLKSKSVNNSIINNIAGDFNLFRLLEQTQELFSSKLSSILNIIF